MKKRNIPRASIVIIASIVAIPSASAQKQWTLRECTEYAVSHNLQIKQKDNQRRQQELQLSTAKNSPCQT